MQPEWTYFSQQIGRFIHSRVQNSADADDITQNTLLKIHQNIDSLNDKTKLESWIYAIARNHINSHFRQHKTDPIANGSATKLDFLPMQDEDEAAIFELACCLEPFIKNLNPSAQEALNATSFNGQSQVDYAKGANIPLPTAKARVQRARKQLAKEISKCCKYQQGEIISQNKCIL
ncbi:MAG: sigma-70 family RNA polymerase sigma factor [Rhizobiales bacterium]|nr:sigma-70 family RNA polymerase sigma factor [Hyphomicrobiales bacterium]NRB13786.1 sigma-70 family RNA polymerase sigma factor [Hyphomicrobiales bacterium]